MTTLISCEAQKIDRIDWLTDKENYRAREREKNYIRIEDRRMVENRETIIKIYMWFVAWQTDGVSFTNSS